MRTNFLIEFLIIISHMKSYFIDSIFLCNNNTRNIVFFVVILVLLNSTIKFDTPSFNRNNFAEEEKKSCTTIYLCRLQRNTSLNLP